MAEDEWIERVETDPIPEGKVRIRDNGDWTSSVYLNAPEWLGWSRQPGDYLIVAYLPLKDDQ